MDLPILNLHECVEAIGACVRAGRVPLVIGTPGIAKTSLAKAIAKPLGKALGFDDYQTEFCILSNRESVDVGGYPVVQPDGSVECRPFGSLRRATEEPRLLILDEFLTTPQSVQGPALRLTLERVAGEHPLHDQTRIICLANDPDHAPGGIQMTAALVNRLCILRCAPQVTEVADYFEGHPEASFETIELDLPDAATWSERRGALMSSLGALFRVKPDLIDHEPPPASVAEGEPFATPRSWEACCESLAALKPVHVATASKVAHAVISGYVGAGKGIAYLGILRARMYLPSIADILQHPDTAKIPDPQATYDGKAIGRDINFAAIPLLLEVGRTDCAAAWVYAERLPPEVMAAVAKTLTSNLKIPPNSPWRKKGMEIMFRVGAELTAKSPKAA